jgi:CheY-like chemotaxis protein
MKTILVVEDDANQCSLYEEELIDDGYHIVCVSNGREAIRVVEDSSGAAIDCVILDINMPQVDGLEVLSHVLELRPHLPIIIYTAYASYQDNFMSWGANNYLIKQSDLTELKLTIQKLLP